MATRAELERALRQADAQGNVEDAKKLANAIRKLDEDDERAGYFQSAGAGVVSGVGKAVEGITTLGTTLVDLGLGTELTKQVEKKI